MEELLLAWYSRFGRDLPWRKTRDPYAILVAEIALQQTQVDRVIPRYLAWLARWPTVEALAAAYQYAQGANLRRTLIQREGKDPLGEC